MVEIPYKGIINSIETTICRIADVIYKAGRLAGHFIYVLSLRYRNAASKNAEPIAQIFINTIRNDSLFPFYLSSLNNIEIHSISFKNSPLSINEMIQLIDKMKKAHKITFLSYKRNTLLEKINEAKVEIYSKVNALYMDFFSKTLGLGPIEEAMNTIENRINKAINKANSLKPSSLKEKGTPLEKLNSFFNSLKSTDKLLTNCSIQLGKRAHLIGEMQKQISPNLKSLEETSETTLFNKNSKSIKACFHLFDQFKKLDIRLLELKFMHSSFLKSTKHLKAKYEKEKAIDMVNFFKMYPYNYRKSTIIKNL